VALGAGELSGLAELIGLEIGATELVGGTAPTARSAGFTEGAGSVEAGVGFVTVPGGPTADDGPGLGVGEVVTAAGGRSFISSRRSPLWVLPLCA
jgi:hypothetical protein